MVSLWFNEFNFIHFILKFPNHFIIAYPWCDGHFTSISACGVWRARAGVQVSRRELYTHIHLDYTRVEILSCIRKKKKSKPYSMWLFFPFLLVGLWNSDKKRGNDLKKICSPMTLDQSIKYGLIYYLKYIYIYIWVGFKLNLV